ncbi:16643_t:CDS:2 [Acaulospora colombiana]|uniref:16643_t:CDS:1 n=1 Tax=Acaulospora colombiana TaxID=27376 RepID=A0ACA9JXY1_9GLOM|nr:16643_t:CDS:2 [Acaulospora colombiana]
MTVHVVIRFNEPVNKTFTFTEPDSLELGRSSFPPDPSISKKQVLFEIKDGRVYATDKYPFTVTITRTEVETPTTHEFRSPTRVEKVPHLSAEQVISKFKKEKEITPLPSSHQGSVDTPSQLLGELLYSQDTIRDDDTIRGEEDIYNRTYENDEESSGAHTSDEGVEGDSDELKSVESEENFFTDESSYLGSFRESSDDESEEEEEVEIEGKRKTAECIHPDNRQRLFSSSEVPLDVKPTCVNVVSNEKGEETVEITWNESLSKLPTPQTILSSSPNLLPNGEVHRSAYPISFLKSYGSKFSADRIRFNDMKPTTWNRNSILESNLWIDHSDYMNCDKELLKSLRQLWDYGLVFLKGVPVDLNADDGNESIKNVVKRIGTIRSSFYGDVFDVISARDAKNIAYTNLQLGLHMDLLYYEAPPGLQFLHCLKNSEVGGTNIFTDSLMAADNFKLTFPEDFDLLTKTALTFNFINNGHHMHYNRPAIAIDEHNGTMTVNYSPPFSGPIESLLPSTPPTVSQMESDEPDDDDEKTLKFYQAYRRFCAFIEDPELKYELKLKPGTLPMGSSQTGPNDHRTILVSTEHLTPLRTPRNPADGCT